MYPPWNSRHPKNKQRKDNQPSLKVKDRAMLKTIWEADKEKRNCLLYLGTKRKTQSRSQGLVTAKSRLAKKGLTIPRLKLVAGHMTPNLVSNVRDALKGFLLEGVYC